MTFFAAGESAGDAQRGECRLGAGGRETDELSAGAGINHLFGQVDDRLVETVERGAPGDLLAHSGDDGGMGVAENHRPRAHHKIDVVTSFDVMDVTTLAADKDGGCLVGQAKHAQTPANEVLIRRREEILLRTICHSNTVKLAAWNPNFSIADGEM